jgi:hypothetical protein
MLLRTVTLTGRARRRSWWAYPRRCALAIDAHGTAIPAQGMSPRRSAARMPIPVSSWAWLRPRTAWASCVALRRSSWCTSRSAAACWRYVEHRAGVGLLRSESAGQPGKGVRHRDRAPLAAAVCWANLTHALICYSRGVPILLGKAVRTPGTLFASSRVGHQASHAHLKRLPWSSGTASLPAAYLSKWVSFLAHKTPVRVTASKEPP